MSVEQQATRVASGAKSALKALIQKLGGTVSDTTKIDGYADIVDAMALAAMKPSSHASTHKTGGSDAIAPADIGAAASSHTHTKANITDFPTSMTPTAHKATHKTGGSDAIAPADIGAAAASHTHTKSQITDFPTSMTPAAHKASHKTGGADAIAPGDIGAAAATHSHTKSQITDFPASMAPTAHKASHKTGGADAIAPADIGAAAKQVVVPITLTVAGWNASTKRQVATVAGVLADASRQVIQMGFSTEAAILAYGAAGILAVAQGAGTLTFQCSTVPTEAIAVNIIIQAL